MNETRDKLIGPGAPARRTLAGSNVRKNHLLELPRFPDNTLLYIEEIHFRAETVTPLLKDIEGYPCQPGKN